MIRFLLWLALAVSWGLFLIFVVDLPAVVEFILGLLGGWLIRIALDDLV